jgi:hypothetical protein
VASSHGVRTVHSELRRAKYEWKRYNKRAQQDRKDQQVFDNQVASDQATERAETWRNVIAKVNKVVRPRRHERMNEKAKKDKHAEHSCGHELRLIVEDPVDDSLAVERDTFHVKD